MTKITTFLSKIYLTILYVFIPVIVWAKDDDKAENICKTLEEYQQDGTGDNFILSDAYNTIISVSVNLVNLSWNKFAPSLLSLVILGSAIYIAVYTLKNLGSFSQQDMAAYLSNGKTGLLPLMTKTVVVVILLSSQNYIYDFLINPFIRTCMEIGQSINGGFGSGSFSGVGSVNGLFNSVLDKAKAYNDSIYKIVAMGRLLWCVSWAPDQFVDVHFKLLPFASALFIYGWILIISVSFYMIDVIMRLAVACILMPMAIACGYCKLTSQYTKSNWSLIVNVGFNFLVLGAVIKFVTTMINTAMGGGISELNKKLAEAVLTDEDVKAVEESLTVGSIILTAISLIIGMKLFMGLEPIVDNLSSSKSVGSVGKEAGAKTFQTARKAAGVVTSPIRGVAAGAVQEAGDRIVGSAPIMAARRTARNAKTKVKNTVKRALGLK